MADVQSSLVVSSGDVVLDRRFEWARQSLVAGDFAGAADLLEQTLEMAPRYAPAWFALGQAREALGEQDAAVAAFQTALTYDPEDVQGATLRLVRLGAQPASAMPCGYVQALYDAYAPRFEHALVERLNYRAPGLLLRKVLSLRPQAHFENVLDLGCGTGLAGVAFKPHCARLTGVDLSPVMLAKAREKGIYDRLAEGEAMTFAAEEVAAGRHCDLVLAADVFIYFHELMQLQALTPLIRPGGLLAFTVETHEGDDVILRDTLRYAHGKAHVCAALDAAGLQILTIEPAVSRSEKGDPVAGLVVVAAKP